MHRMRWTCVCSLLTLWLATLSTPAQVNTGTLTGRVFDPQGAVVIGAEVTIKNLATNATRSTTTDDTGRYQFLALPPGRYELSVQAEGFARLINPELTVSIGQVAEFNPTLQLARGQETITVSEATELIETSRTSVAETINQQRINNLPINGRNYIQFALTTSQAARDSAPSIGAAPTSGLNFQGQRARSNMVSVDGADSVDNSVNGIRATVSQEAVQEFQLLVSNFNAEFGRATGAVINIVTKSGSNEFHGSAFGYLRHKNIQARNPFSVAVDPDTGALIPTKQEFTRAQAGLAFGGPIRRDETFYFFSYETTRRQETGFTNIGANNFGLVQTPVPADLVPLIGPVPGLLTPEQAAFVANTALPVALRAQYFGLVREASSVALTGATTATLGGAPIFITTGAPLPASFVALNSLRGNYPISEGTSLWSARLDHRWNEANNTFLRVSVAPSLVTGIQVNAQNQNFGQNAGNRTSRQQTRDLAVVAQHVTAFSPTVFNEARFQFARRGLHYGFSDLPGGDQVAVNIPGFAFFGREPFSTVDRIERRTQVSDNASWIRGRHTIKFGGDFNLIQLRSDKEQIFELNFGGLFNFGGLGATSVGFPSIAPGFSAVQAYGMGLPQVFVQGIGRSNKPFNNYVYAFYLQDSWKLLPRLMLNLGVRYDYEHTPLFTPGTALNAGAEAIMGLVEGIPRDTDNVAPRVALAWDPWGDGKTVVRAGYGIFYDHPLLAVAFNSTTAEGALSTQLITFGGAPSTTSIALNPAALNATNIFQGILNTTGVPNTGYLPNQQRFDPKLENSIFVNQNFIAAGFPIAALPFTLHVDREFDFAYAQQANLTIERQLWRDYKFSIAYTWTKGTKLNRPRNINAPDPGLLVTNAANAIVSGLIAPGTDPRQVVVPVGAPNSCVNTVGGGSLFLIAPGALATGFSAANCGGPPIGFVGTAAFFNFFRPSGPNPSFAGLAGGFAVQQALAAVAGFPTGFGSTPIPWGDVVQQESTGNSIYHGMTVTFSKRFARHFEFLTSWTYSHTIDDSTDLQTLLAPQDNRRPDLERASSVFDQRHRWVTSAVLESPFQRTDDGFWRKFFADFTVAPIFEIAAGRPFMVLTGSDLNLDFGSNTDRPSIGTGSVTSPFIPGATFGSPSRCDVVNPIVPSPPFGCTGNLSRNPFTREETIVFDLRISRRFWFTEQLNLEFITDMFNLFNRFNVADVNPLCNPLGGSTCTAGEPTASLDPRQFQFALKLNW